MASIQGIYVALFGRPADPAGLAYFNDITNNGQDLDAIDSLAGEPEYLNRFTGMSNEEIVNSIYQALFERDGEPAGVAFFVAELEAGHLNINNIAINILDGAQGDDLAMVEAKIDAADLFTASLDTQAEIDAYTNPADGRAFLDDVTPDNMPTQAEIDAYIAAEVLEENQAPGGGGGGSGGNPDPEPAYVNSYGDLEATTDSGELFAGKGNPADGFALSVNEGEGIELGLDVRYNQDGTDVDPDAEGSSVWTVPLGAQDDVRFAYSVASEDGLGDYDFRLSIDTDGSANEQFLQLDLAQDGTPETYDFNNGNSVYDWVLSNAPEFAVINDDGGDVEGTVSQNVQSLQWYVPGEGRMAGDEHVVRLEAFEKGTDTVVAETEVTIKYSGHTERVLEDFDGNSDMVVTAGGYGAVELTEDGSAIFSQIGDVGDETGPFTKFDGYREDGPKVVTTSVDVYLAEDIISQDEGFDYSVAANKADGSGFLRDFIFHIANDGDSIVVGASNNTSYDPHVAANAIKIDDGWYTLEHTMYENGTGDLEVRMRVLDAGGNMKFQTTLSSPADDFSNFGGNRYGWFTNIDVEEGVEVDNWALAAQYFENNPTA